MQERRIFLEASEISDPLLRQAFLEKACGGDLELMARIQSLLAVMNRLGSFLDSQGDGETDSTTHSASSRQGTPHFAETKDWSALDSEVADGTAGEPIDLGFLQSSDIPGLLGTLGHYQIRDVLGQGAFGVVLGGRDTKLERDVAIKVLLPHLARTSPPRKRFLREARAGAAIRHPNVIQVYAVEEEPVPYIVMERVRGSTLQTWIEDEGPLEMPRILPIAIQLAQALAAAHTSGLIHRDVKPSNILIEDRGELRVVLTDFGLARTMDDASLTQSGFVAGTPMYMSPEQAQGSSIDPRSDQFSLGSVLYLMTTGRPPFRASSSLGVMRRVSQASPRPIQEIIPDAPAWLCKIIQRLMMQHPNDRYASLDPVVAELKRAHASWIEHGDVPSDVNASTSPQLKSLDAGALSHPSRSARSAIPMIAIGMIALSSLIFGIWWSWKSNNPSETIAGKVDSNGIVAAPIASALSLDREGNRTTRMDAQTKFAEFWPSDAPPPAVLPFEASQASAYQQRWADYLKLPVDFVDPLGIPFRLIPPGIFQMGSTPEEIDLALGWTNKEPFWIECVRSEGPQHLVMITRPFYMSATEITQAQFESVMSTNPSRFQQAGASSALVQGQDTLRFPVEGISWTQAAEFCRRVNLRLQLPCTTLDTPRIAVADGWPGSYGLPTEAQWEFACRAGTSTAFWTGDSVEVVHQNENVSHQLPSTVAVGSYRANAFGLFDMHGNVEEHVYDAWSPSYYQETAKRISVDPIGPDGKDYPLRVVRGGDCDFWSLVSRSASRWASDVAWRPSFHTGFRLTLSTQAVKRLQHLREHSPVNDFVEVHGIELEPFRDWLASINPRYVPCSINIRVGESPVRFDAIAINSSSKRPWQVNFFSGASEAEADFQSMRGTHANHWRMQIPTDANENNAVHSPPTGLVLWTEQDAPWGTWHGDKNTMIQEMKASGLDGWIPTSIECIHDQDGFRFGYSHSLQPGIGHHVWDSLSLEEFQSKVVEYQHRGWRPQWMQLHVGTDALTIATVFRENSAKLKWDVDFDLAEDDYIKQLAQRRVEGFYPLGVGSYLQSGQVRYVVVWLEADFK